MADLPEPPRGRNDFPPPAEPSIPRSHAFPSINQQSDPSLLNEAKLRQLLEQQAKIQAEIKALLPANDGLDFRRELTMLNHKHKILKACQEEQGLGIVVLSEAEECRVRQYMCECLELTCLQSPAYPSVQDLLDKGVLPMRSIQPAGFEEWLRSNATKHDPILKNQPHRSQSTASFKCPEPDCVHYIYGFGARDHLDLHVKEHHPLMFTASLMGSIMSGPNSSVVDLPGSGPWNARLEDVRWKVASPDSLGTGSVASDRRLPKLQDIFRETSSSSSSKTYSFVPEYPQGSEYHELHDNTQIHPVKRSRLMEDSPSGILRPMKEINPCLRCKVLKKKCDPDDPCSLCPEQDDYAEGDHWKVLGCHRGPLSSFSEVILPAKFFPRDNLDRRPERSNHSLTTNQQDTFLSCWREESKYFNAQDMIDELGNPLENHIPSENTELVSDPPIYVLLKTMNFDSGASAYNLLDLLAFSSSIFKHHNLQDSCYTLLTASKFLLREAFILRETTRIQKGDQPIQAWLVKSGGIIYNRHEVLRSAVEQFLFHFDDLSSKRTHLEPKSWMALFCSFCIFSAARTLLSDALFEISDGQNAWTSSDIIAMYSVYKALVSTFMWSTTSLLDDTTSSLTPEELSLFGSLQRIVQKEKWANYDIMFTKEFLMGLGGGFRTNGVFNGFVKQKWSFGPHRVAANDHQSRVNQEIETPHRRDASISSYSAIGSTSGKKNWREEKWDGEQPGRERFIPIATSTYKRPNHERVKCNLCNAHPDGFRGEHELQRHKDREHSLLLKKWICIEPVDYPEGGARPDFPLSSCKACVQTKKRYGAYYNAAAHLRRAHFRSKTRSKHGRTPGESRGGSGGDWPPMSVLKYWMKEVEEVVADFVDKSGDEDAGYDTPVISEDRSEPRTRQAYTSFEPALSQARSAVHDYRTPLSVIHVEGKASHSTPQQPLLAPTPIIRRDPANEPSVPSGQYSSYPQSSWGGSKDTVMLQRDEESLTVPENSRRSISTVAELSAERHGRCTYPECGKVFRDLRAHMLTHQNERPEKCPIPTCDYHMKGFARKYDKNRHALTHYNGVMVCPFCLGSGTPAEKSFNRADVFKRHLTSVHGVEQTPPNSRKAISKPARALPAGTDGKCSICKEKFDSAQMYYEHLDDCVLRVVAPSTDPVREQTDPPVVASPSIMQDTSGPSSAVTVTHGLKED
ncbi:hypothetical protein BGZ60DRAFT_533747 [Tricladium varicosporioides]|nr:hypothetical protein BGZ60DRAFT_533747 [Hymenoscyphus varicosporioides]